MDAYIDKIKEVAIPLLESNDIELVDLRLRRNGRRIILGFLVDKPCGGISLDECARLNEEIGELLDKDALIQDSFILEVSSPGLDRPLMTIKDFSRAKDKNIRIFLGESIGGKIELVGRIVSVGENCVVINVGDQETEIPIEKINKAKQIF